MSKVKKFIPIIIIVSLILVAFISYAFYDRVAIRYLEIQEGTLEEEYSKGGPFEALSETVLDDEGKDLYQIYYPKDSDGNLPTIVWGNGTYAQPKEYDGLMRHLATWGFFVIDTYSAQTGTGEPMSQALEYVISEDKNSEGKLYNLIDEENIGFVGHSQGASGVINAHTNFDNGKNIKAIVVVSLPSERLTDLIHKYEPEKITAPTLLLTGTRDDYISSFDTNYKVYERLEEGIPSAIAVATGGGHNQIQTEGGKYRSLITGWMRIFLADDEKAKMLFESGTGDIYKNVGWQDSVTKGL